MRWAYLYQREKLSELPGEKLPGGGGDHDPDGFCHQLPGNRHLNALDGIYDMWYLNLTDRRPIHDAG